MLDKLYKNQSLIYKYFLYVVSIFCIVFFFPKGGKFKYEFQKGKPWQYENLYAPFDFSVKKTEAELAAEKQRIIDGQYTYYRFDEALAKEVYQEFEADFGGTFKTDEYSAAELNRIKKAGQAVLDQVYENGILQKSYPNEAGKRYT